MEKIFNFTKPYHLRRIFLFVYGLYFDETLLYYGGFTRMLELRNAMNAAFNNGFYYGMQAIIEKECKWAQSK